MFAMTECSLTAANEALDPIVDRSKSLTEHLSGFDENSLAHFEAVERDR